MCLMQQCLPTNSPRKGRAGQGGEASRPRWVTRKREREEGGGEESGKEKVEMTEADSGQ